MEKLFINRSPFVNAFIESNLFANLNVSDCTLKTENGRETIIYKSFTVCCCFQSNQTTKTLVRFSLDKVVDELNHNKSHDSMLN